PARRSGTASVWPCRINHILPALFFPENSTSPNRVALWRTLQRAASRLIGTLVFPRRYPKFHVPLRYRALFISQFLPQFAAPTRTFGSTVLRSALASIASSICPVSISSHVWSPQRTSAFGSGLRGLLAELSKIPRTSIRVPFGSSLGFSSM